MTTSSSTRDWVRRSDAPASVVVGTALMVLVAASTMAGGCQKSLFPENQPRTQFEAYEIMRQRYVPLEEPDVFGTPRPAIRARLTPER